MAESHQPARDAAYALGMKIYDNDWYLRFGLGYDEAAALLADWGVTFVLTQSRLLPMPDSAVKSVVPPELAERYAAYDDRRFRDALARRGIRYVASCLMMFDPEALAADPALEAIDATGKRQEKIDWYIGIPPIRATHVANKIARIEAAVRALEPDGLHLGFMRWPGFWELWMPHHRQQDFPDFSYDAATLDAFVAATGVALPTRAPAAAAAWIGANARPQWVDWKCRVVVDVVRQVRDAARRIKPEVQMVLNTLPFGTGDYDNAVETVFGQRFEWLAEVIDVFEVMTYHQILKRGADWPAAIGAQIKARTGRTTVCTLQAAPLYLDGMHAGEDRSRSLDAMELASVSGQVAQSTVDGQVFFLWSDFLRQTLEQSDTSRVDVIRRLARARPL
ncbi:MAG: hypothetical protein ACKVP7_20100 [Hyphomicrobiaceae bacterium]